MATERFPRILIVTNKSDITTDLVVRELRRRRVDFFRFNTEEFPTAARVHYSPTIDGVEGILSTSSGSYNLGEVTGVLYRRPGEPDTSHVIRDAASFADREAVSTLEGLWECMQGVWISRPSSIRKAEHKPLQIQVAKQLGFLVPATLVTNDLERLQLFRNNRDEIIAKSVSHGRIQSDHYHAAVFAVKLDNSEQVTRNEVAATPSIYQGFIHKKADYRVTIIGRSVFVARIDSLQHPDAVVDWRRAGSGKLTITPAKLPDSIIKSCFQMVRAFDLKFSSIDLIENQDSNFAFLDLNPNGQWGWLQLKTGESYAAAFVNELIKATE